MRIAGLMVAGLLALGCLLIPVAVPAVRARCRDGGVAAVLYFACLGAGYMMLEMAFLHKLVLYLGDPVHAAAAACSIASVRTPYRPRRLAMVAPTGPKPMVWNSVAMPAKNIDIWIM